MGTSAGTVLIVGADRHLRSRVEELGRDVGMHVRVLPDAAALSQHGRLDEASCVVFNMREGDADPARTMSEIGMRIPTIFLSGDADVATSVAAMKAGAFDFLTKPIDGAQLLRAICAALAEDLRHLEAERTTRLVHKRFVTLTLREREAFFGVTDGQLNKQIAADLGISEKTVKVHRARAARKLEALSLAELVRIADRIRPADVGGPARLAWPVVSA